MPEHDHVGIECLNIFRRVSQRFTFGRAAAGAVEGNDIRAQSLRGHVEGHARSRARFEEKIDDGFSPERRNFFHAAGKRVFKRAGGGMNLLNLGE